MAQQWTPDSWQQRTALQMPDYTDAALLDGALNKLCGFPPLVFAGEVNALRRRLAQVFGRKWLPIARW